MKIALVHNQTPETLSVAAKFKEMCLSEKIEIVTDYPDLVVSIGGDGTLLSAFHKYEDQLSQVRFVGIHTGHLGFYTDWRTYELPELVESLKHDKGESVSYPLLDVRVKYADEEEETRYIALNEASLKKMDGTMVCDIYVKDELFETFRGDGLCVSTPTGSTGFSKSLGGAVIHPRTEAIQLTEMASVNNRIYRTLSSPMIIAKDEWIVIYPHKEDRLILSVDHLTFKKRSIERLVYRIAQERVHFARYRHTHFWDRVEDAFIGVKKNDRNERTKER
ncbi:NAD kinase [Trichococcus pasteurii]|jgi:NAD+ kinase|uniref:NAD kinase n=1 Tax=Trichococcus pasteurii TaxID=43064 RepID=A0A1W1IIS9_9LACT|nr:NAD kinase [Trichococcus pasteurii]SFE73371.1 NAD+ kinase [Trichococcus pasteurii]SLM52653.1 atp-nad kinase ppnk-type all-beta [Trichococcus pasteurii]SSB93534.1 atp-nad kinase ppnk-type all-beta [Trichococcus pasteurii]HEX5350521.1 NAD kinase [Trichococcus sp.]